MHGPAWQTLLKHIPEDRQNKLMLTTTAGVEIAIQVLLRIDHECVAIRGRLAGSQDAGRVFFVPYDRIEMIGFSVEMKESEFADIFGSLAFPAPTVPGQPVAAAAPQAESNPQPQAEPAQAPAGTEIAAATPAPPIAPSSQPSAEAVNPFALGSSRTPTLIKSVVLERFRARNSSSGNGQEG
jgi:hypothetical protein